MKVLKAGLLCVLIGWMSSISAQGYYPAQQNFRGETSQPDPVVVLRHGLDKLMRFAGQKQQPGRQETMLFLEKEISPYFDFDYMARWVGGRQWSYMSPQARVRMSAELQQLFLTTLSQKLSQYGGQGFKVLRPKPDGTGGVSVPVAVLNPRGYPAKLNFRFYVSKAEGWKVFDVSANGSSALVYYRKYFNQKRKRQINQQLAPRFR